MDYIFTCSQIAGFFVRLYGSIDGVSMVWYLVLLGCFGFLMAPWASEKRLDLDYGINRIDVNGDGREDLILRARWDVATAHPADRYSIILDLPQKDFSERFYEVGIEDDLTTGILTFEGADCVLTGYVFILNNNRLMVYKYHREIGKGFAEREKVRRTTYALVSRELHDDGGVGYSPYYLKKIKETILDGVWCDVRDVM